MYVDASIPYRLNTIRFVQMAGRPDCSATRPRILADAHTSSGRHCDMIGPLSGESVRNGERDEGKGYGTGDIDREAGCNPRDEGHPDKWPVCLRRAGTDKIVLACIDL